MFRTTVLLALSALACHAASVPASVVREHFSVSDDIDQLYSIIMVGDFDEAVTKSEELVKKNRGLIITSVINKLLDEEQRNLIDYAFHLRVKNGKSIIDEYFPNQFRSIYDEVPVKLISTSDGMAIKLGNEIDSDGDRAAYGDGSDSSGENVSWIFLPGVSSTGEYNFKLYNVLYKQYLKLGTAIDGNGEHTAYGSPHSDTDSHLWYLLPKKYEDQLLFNIYNVEYNQALKLGGPVNSEGDRTVKSQHSQLTDDIDQVQWDVKPL